MFTNDTDMICIEYLPDLLPGVLELVEMSYIATSFVMVLLHIPAFICLI